MSFFYKLIYGSNKNIEKRNLIWNLFASIFYAAISMLLGFFIVKIKGDREGGIFFFAFSTLAQQIYILAYFGIRPIQITDTKYRYSFSEYLIFRLITISFAFFIGLFYTILFAKDYFIFSIYIIMILYKLVDAFSDLLECEWQRRGKLYIGAKGIFFRTFISSSLFLLSLYLTKNLIFSSLVFLFSLILYVGIFIYYPLKYENIKKKFSFANIKLLYVSSKCLFISSFLDLYIFASSKFAINKYLSNEHNAYYTTLFIPTSIINLLAGIIIRPTLTKLSLFYDKYEVSKFKKTSNKLLSIILVFSVFILGFTLIFSKYFLKIIFTSKTPTEILEYSQILFLIILGGCFYAIMNLMYYLLVILKKEKRIFAIYIFASIIAFILSNMLTKKFNMLGAAISYLVIMILLSLIFSAVVYKNIRKWEADGKYS